MVLKLVIMNTEFCKLIGFNEEEINEMSQEKFVKLMDMEILSTNVTVAEICENQEVEIVGEEDDIMFDENGKLIDDNAVISPMSYESNNTEKIYSTSDSSKKLTTYVSYVKVDNEYKIYVKQNIDWITTPTARLSDIISIGYTDNIRVGEDNLYPDLEVNVTYTQTHYYKIGWKYGPGDYDEGTEVEKIKETYDGSDQSMINHEVGEYIAFQLDLKDNVIIDGSSRRYYFIDKKTYSDIKITMETTFDTNISTLTGTEIKSYYTHQTGKGTFDWGKITFSSQPPYLVYQTTWYIDDPSYEQSLYNSINIKFD